MKEGDIILFQVVIKERYRPYNCHIILKASISNFSKQREFSVYFPFAKLG